MSEHRNVTSANAGVHGKGGGGMDGSREAAKERGCPELRVRTDGNLKAGRDTLPLILTCEERDDWNRN